MADHLFCIIKQFLERRVDDRPLLIGYSGGPDSLALYHLIRETRLVPIHLVHIDHGWRPESKKEAESLKKDAADSFHLHTLEGMEGPNLEDRCREKRLAFFAKVYEEIGAQALVLGHHRDDQAETVLKRLFEGGKLVGLEEEREIRGMRVWRPLLSVSKKEIMAWCEKRGLDPIIDSTNRDSRYLRGRMREELLPELERMFGKGVRSNLAALGTKFASIEAYLDKKIAHVMEKSEIETESLDDIEIKHLLSKKTDLSRDAIEIVLDLVRKNRVGKKVENVEIKRGRRLIIKKKESMLK